MKSLKGIFPSLLTPFDTNSRINAKALRLLVRLNLKKGVDGFYVCGSTGEAFLLNLRERKEILETALDEACGKCAIIAHVGCLSTDDTIELARHAAACGVDAVSSVTPFYYPYTWEEIRQYYYELADSVSVPVIVYNFPARTGIALTLERASCFALDGRFAGIKHTSQDFFALERFKHLRPDFIMYNGYDEMFLSGLAAGADGGIGSTYNFMAEKFITIKSLFEQGKHREAREIQKQVNDIIAVLVQFGVLQTEKAILTYMGIECGECRRPFLPLDDEKMKIVREIVEKNHFQASE